MQNNVSLSHRITRLGVRLRDSEWRRYGALLLLGKAVGVGALLIAAMLINPDLIGRKTFAADPVLKGTTSSIRLTRSGH
jgi:hypothetical protein